MNGKGSKPRPFSVKIEKYGQNWDEIFRKKKKTQPPAKTLPEPAAENDPQTTGSPILAN